MRTSEALEHYVLDLWRAKSATPAPLVVFIHGGGFRGGDKTNLAPALLAKCLDTGISVAAINYRLSQQAAFPAPMLDSARAIQVLRSKAAEWNLDPKRFAATGGSAGAGISLWIGFHDDLADPASADAFCASRLGGDWGQAFGTLNASVPFAGIIARAWGEAG